ncbi:MAG: phenylalanine--tRNA ligase subunit beta [Chitinispirillales bacterium]|jgi:phenylalanyl-tRNA synthetase beta chain|nr:phenylalanine--tRNA ligase subunit beta [Chitinispirillales bacterium]
MKIVYSWLKDFVDINVPVQEVADALTKAGIEVASINSIHIPDGVKVAKVISKNPHPNADKLSLCEVDAGNGEILQIVCGAPNVTASMTVALATEGTVLGEDFTIKKAKIRGVESRGMLCSEKELGISDNNSGIISLPSDYRTGAPLSEYIVDDAVIEIEITPDRGDCLSVLGVAREVSASFGKPLKQTARIPEEKNGDSISSAISVNIETKERCPRYMGRLVRGVTIGPSPEWMQRRLSMAGLRPINNIVDITNYILIQYGQPMHAFDYNAVDGRKIIVKQSQSLGISQFTTLDGIERKLAGDDLLICDAKKPTALAGIMGGLGSQITDSTKDVFLECAFFEQTGVRKTSKRLGLSTDSSYRFERGVDPAQGLENAINTAAYLMQEIAGGTVSAGKIDTHSEPFPEKKMTLRPSRASRILGVEFDEERITALLTSIGIITTKEGDDKLQCSVPLFRHDISEEADLVEEVGRLFGYDKIPAVQYSQVKLTNPPSCTETNRDNARSALCYFGLNELITNSMVSEAKRKLITPSTEPVKILNPLNPDMTEMRTTLAITLLESVAYNLNRKNNNNRFFEIGKTFRPDSTTGLAQEKDILAIIIEGSCFPKSWGNVELQNDFFILKGIIETFADHCALDSFSYSKLEQHGPLYTPESASIRGSNGIMGTIGRVSEQICKTFGIKSSVFYAELDLTAWLSTPKPLPKYKNLPKFPALERDFSFVMPDTLDSDTVKKEIESLSGLVGNVRPFDVYRGEKLGAGSKSVTFSVEFRSPEKTLNDDDVQDVCNKIILVMKEKHSAELRK